MTMLDRFSQRAALCALLLVFNFAVAHADEVQDANKLFKQGQQAQALEKVNAYLAHKPKDASARFLKGLIMAEQGNTDEAIRIFSALTEDYPELPEPYNNLAVLYAGQGQYEKAKAALEMAIRTHPSYATAHENLGDIYAKMASQAYDRALQLDKSNTSTQTKLALIKDLFSGTGKGGKVVANRDVASTAATKPSTPASATTVVASAATTKPSAPVSATPPAASTAATKPSAPASTTTVVASAPATTTGSLPPVQPVAAVSAVALPPALPTASTGKPAAATDGSKEVLKAVHDWAAAWSANDVPQYLAFYAKDFKIPNQQSRSDWEEQRRERIAKPKSIQVGIGAAKVHLLDSSRAVVSFRQSYRSGTLRTSTLKTLEMVKSNGKWQILEERTGK